LIALTNTQDVVLKFKGNLIMKKQNESAAGGLQKLPSVDTLLKNPDLESYITGIGREVVADSIRQAVEELRKLLIAQKPTQMDEATIRQKIIADTKRRLKAITSPYYRRVINATGIILHTGLGRAVLPSQALRQIQDELSGYSLLQLGVETGKRSKRDECIEWLLRQLTGAEAATVVNNNAAATFIVLTLAGCYGF
jgi:L-seryl-tRNA(Ser) seleniumtransferase